MMLEYACQSDTQRPSAAQYGALPKIIMGREQPSESIVVRLIASHPLAARHVQQILSRRRNVRTSVDAELPTRAPSGSPSCTTS